MYERLLTDELIKEFESFLRLEERSDSTISKYIHDVRCFASFAVNKPVSKNLLLDYKVLLQTNYLVSSANSMIAALNSFFHFAGWDEFHLKQFRVQRKVYCPVNKELSKAEYFRLVDTAKRQKNRRLYLILQTICGTGIRISELKYITVDAVIKGEAVVSCKNKTRTVFIVRALQKQLVSYIKLQNIVSGSVFVTRSNKPVDRSNIWREMKSLCDKAGISAEKVFPHNLRHLFARTFYSIEKDIMKLADVLGHCSINTTRLYIISTGFEHRRKMELMKLII